ncbi:MAG: helix-turn-helix domain-containing protein [Verrucomicrobiota bacterium JB023]|nr:helix-turn-helix domain-containing protein [Verrucomicrobiota bacterium JB023]
MAAHERTSAEGLAAHLPGRLIASSSGPAWKDVLVQIFSRQLFEDSVIVPAVAEPVLVWITSGTVILDERDIGGKWETNRISAGDFLLTMSPTPYELRWRAVGTEPFEPMHLYLSLPLFERAYREVFGKTARTRPLQEISGHQDQVVSVIMAQLRDELTTRKPPSKLFVQGIVQSLAVYLVRTYTDPHADTLSHYSGLTIFKLRKVTELMEGRLSEKFDLAAFARVAEMSDFHFSRMFKKATGFSPSHYFIHLRMVEARRLLRETNLSIIDIGLEVGYSSASHFSQAFRREVGVSPTRYRD